uniref:RsmB/NOP family class I SAM-dependent RNA methyltransferase n=1 Tax=Mobilicoccus massiliensis TaxID=1522310 RepID=UPI0036F32FDE
MADGAYANLDLPQRLRGARLDARDAAFATELVYGVTRLRGRYDAIIAQCAGRPLERIDPPVLDVLRLGAHQLLGMRVPAHAAVDATVGLARGTVGAGASAFTNAVLRRISEKSLDEWLAIVAPTAPPPADTTSSPTDTASSPTGTTWTPTDTSPVAAGTTSSVAEVASSTNLDPAGAPESPTTPDASAAPPGPLNLDDVAVAYSHPVWIVRALRQALLADGVSTTDSVDADLLELLEADNTPADVTLVARPGLAELDELLDAGARPGALSPVGAILKSGGDPGRLPAVREGRAAVQDEGSQLLVLALVAAYDASIAAATTTPSTAPPAEAARWLDLCAGPGGKAALLAALAIPRGATLFCNEIGEHRADLVESAVGAAMDAGAEVFVGVGDGRTIGAEEPASFDLVLLDAPCTGLGALRRRPDARWRRTPADVADLIALQEELLASGLDALRPGGVLGYATCSPHDAETRQVVERVLRDRDDVQLLDANAFLRDVVIDATRLPQRAENRPFAQLWPHVHATDAMFLALIRRNAE